MVSIPLDELLHDVPPSLVLASKLLYNNRGGLVIFFAKVKTEMFDHEKLHVYQLQLDFIRWVTVLMDELQQVNAGKTAEARRHLDRASLSILFNIAEGNGKRRQQTRAKFFDDARGSTSESAACLDALVAKNVCRDERVQPGKQILERVFSMLTKLVERFDQNSSSSSSSSSKPSTTRRRTRTNEFKRSLGDSPR